MRFIYLLLGLFLTASGFAQTPEVYQRVRVQLNPTQTFQQLRALGVETDHGQHRPGVFFESEFSKREVRTIQEAGFTTEVRIADLRDHVLHHNHAPHSSAQRDDCASTTTYAYEDPANWHEGTLAGFFRYQEILDEFAEMAAAYPHLIRPLEPIGDITTHDGNSVLWTRVSNNPDVDDAEKPEVLFTALHHAREPGSVAQMIFFLWYALERYETDPEIQFLFDHTELYFIPIVNPDGYLYNEQSSPNGGGFWRKNRRLNPDDSYGVDLNRNYGFEWGFDNQGSSPNPESQTYRGPGPFSEPETQAVREFCEAHEFQIALNYHTFGNLLIYPWGFSDAPTPDADIFNPFATAMTRENNYLAGTGTETVGYTVNGDSDDWMYGEQMSKPKIFSMTPEVGDGNLGFWPPQSEINRIVKSALLMNLTTCHLVHNYGLAEDLSAPYFDASVSNLPVELTRYGLADGSLTLGIEPVSANLLSVGTPQTFTLAQGESTTADFPVTLAADLSNDTEVVFLLTVDNGTWTRRDTIRKPIGVVEPIFSDPGISLENWLVTGGGDWGITTDEFYSAPSSITDSPSGDYGANELSALVLAPQTVPAEAQEVLFTFFGKWDIENDYDYVQLELRVDGGNYVPLCGKYTNPGTPDQGQAFEEPLYDGTQPNWVREEVDLSPFLNAGADTEVRLRFLFYSDGFVERDGFYFDDAELVVVSDVETVSNAVDFIRTDLDVRAVPNPAVGYFTVQVSADRFGELDRPAVRLVDVTGRTVRTEVLRSATQRVDLAGVPSGVYFYQLLENNRPTQAAQRLVVR